jgi:hypothetical protein
METTLSVYLCKQDGTGRATVFITPITDWRQQTPTGKQKQDMAYSINAIRLLACHDNVREGYVAEAITRNTLILLLVETTITYSARGSPLQVEEPLGFILARPDAEGLYIDVICAKRNGSDLLKYFMKYADDHNETITLSSLPSVLSYYPKFKFKFRKSCDQGAVNTLPNVIATRNKLVKPFPVTTENAYADKNYSDFMIRLHQRGLSQSKSSQCNKMIISKKEMIDNDCGSEGYKMMRCKNDLAGGKRRMTRRKPQKRSTRRA